MTDRMTDEELEEARTLVESHPDKHFAVYGREYMAKLITEVDRLKSRERVLMAQSLKRKDIVWEVIRAFELPPDERPFDGHDVEEAGDWVRYKMLEWDNA